MLMWYVLMLYRIGDDVLDSFMHLNCVVSSTQRWTRKLPVRGDLRACKCRGSTYHVAYLPDNQTMIFTIWKHGAVDTMTRI